MRLSGARQASSCGVPFPPPHWRLSQSSTSTHAPYITGTNVGRAAGGESGRHKPFQARRAGSDQMVGCVTGPPSASLGWPLANGPPPDQAGGGWGRAAADWTRARRDGGWGPAHSHPPHSVHRTWRRTCSSGSRCRSFAGVQCSVGTPGARECDASRTCVRPASLEVGG